MVLHDVARDADLFVKLSAPFDTDVFSDRELHVADVLAGPKRLENRVAEAENEQILNRLFSEVVVDAVDLLFVEARQKLAVQSACALQILAEGFFHDDALIGCIRMRRWRHDELRSAQALNDRRNFRGCNGEVKHAVLRGAAITLEPTEFSGEVAVRRGIVEVPLDVRHAFFEVGPSRVIEWFATGKLGDRVLHFARELGFGATRDTHESETSRQQTAQGQVVNCRQKFAPREISGCSEDDERRRFYRAFFRHPLSERIRFPSFHRCLRHRLFPRLPKPQFVAGQAIREPRRRAARVRVTWAHLVHEFVRYFGDDAVADYPRARMTQGSLPRVLVPHPHVRCDGRILGGSPHVEGSRVPVRRLWAWHRGGASVETLLKRYPNLGPARILDALSFAYDNQDLIQADIDREQALFDQQGGPSVGARPLAQLSLPFGDEHPAPSHVASMPERIVPTQLSILERMAPTQVSMPERIIERDEEAAPPRGKSTRKK